ncbi:nuclear transport factor 2 family protein [Brevundimonas sp. BH3]|uniref:nuclear transport factor 2 family protein n=1 Tax=Brevundimonas sp. BH3 TaxID=3133089 RepID=UPI00324DB370
MLTTETMLNPKALESLNRWHRLVEEKNMDELDAILHPDAVFRSPMAFKGYASAPAVKLVLSTVIQVFENFTYHRSFAGDDRSSIILEFSADVGGKSLKGIDMIRFDDDGKIVDFEVMVRPLNGLQALGAEMGARLGHLLPAYKGAG